MINTCTLHKFCILTKWMNLKVDMASSQTHKKPNLLKINRHFFNSYSRLAKKLLYLCENKFYQSI